MTDQTNLQQQSVAFASQIADLADKEQIDFGTIFNGLAIVAGAMLVDYTVDMDGNMNEAELANAIKQFQDSIVLTTKFAKEQVAKIQGFGTI